MNPAWLVGMGLFAGLALASAEHGHWRNALIFTVVVGVFIAAIFLN